MNRRKSKRKKNVLLQPVRRRLTVAVLCALAGIHLARKATLPVGVAALLCALLFGLLIYLMRTRRNALPCVGLMLLLAFNAYAGARLARIDQPTEGTTEFSGRVVEIVSAKRVRLRSVRVAEGEALRRDAYVTLMSAEGEEATLPAVGQTVSGRGRLYAQEGKRNPGGADPYLNARISGTELSGYLLPGWTIGGEPGFSIMDGFRRLRGVMAERTRLLFGESAPLFEAVLFGERSDLDAEIVTAMRYTGVVHLLTVSGLHFSMIAAAVAWLLSFLPIDRKSRFALHALILAFFACLTGAAIGTVRALIMSLMAQLAKALGRRNDSLTSLSVAAFVMICANPLLPLGASFRFSFLTVLGLVLLAEQAAKALRRGATFLPKTAAELLAATACAMTAAAPMQLLLYGYVPLLSLPMNLLCGVLMPAILLGGWVCVLAGMLFLPLGAMLARVVALPGTALLRACMFFGSMEGALLRLPAPYEISLVLVMAVFALFSQKILFGPGRRAARFAVLAALLLLYLPRFHPETAYVQLSVGQGDSAVIRRNGHACAVDCGPTASSDLLRYLRSEGLYCDAVVLTHLDEDHVGAMDALLNSEIRIGEIIAAEPGRGNPPDGEDMLTLARQRGVPVRYVRRGDTLTLCGASFSVLSPDDDLFGDNERSLVLYGELAGTSFLLTGDLPADAEREDFPACDVLKVAHHGSKNATSLAFLESVRPGTALISVGAGNRYGHPTARVLDDLTRIGAKVYRTDISGCLTVRPTEDGYRVETFLKTSPFASP